MPNAGRSEATSRYQEGDKVVVTDKTLAHMKSMVRTSDERGWVSASYIEKLEAHKGTTGQVTQVHPSVGRIMVDFAGKWFVMRDDFVEPAPETQERVA